jgi:SH3-like domain-containing protein
MGPRLWLQRLTTQEWAIAALSVTWLGGLVLVARELFPRIRPATTSLAWLLGGLALLVTAAAIAAGIEERRPSAVVTLATAARFGPLEESQSAFNLPDGAEVTVTDRKDDWVQVRTAGGRTGWIPRTSLAFVAMTSASD